MIELGKNGNETMLRLSDDNREETFVLSESQYLGLQTEGEALLVVDELIQSELDKRIPPMTRKERIRKSVGRFAVWSLGTGALVYGITNDLEIATTLGVYAGTPIAYISFKDNSRNHFTENQRLLSRTDLLRKEFNLFPYSS